MKEFLNDFDKFWLSCQPMESVLKVIPHSDTEGVEINNYSKEDQLIWTVIFHSNKGYSPVFIEYDLSTAIYKLINWLFVNGYIFKEVDREKK